MGAIGDSSSLGQVVPGSRASWSVRAFAVSAVFFGLLLFNLCLPEPQGPADNGDFSRTFSDFSAGPRGYAYYPPPGDPTYGERFFRYYHRFWRTSEPAPGHAHRSSSRLLFFPGRLLAGATGRDFDLAANAGVLALLLAAIAGATLRKLRGAAFVSLALLLVVMADAGISAYSNSFYQEAGAFFFGVALVCVLLLAWRRPGPWELAAVLSIGFLLSTAKIAYGPSVFLVLAVILLAALFRLPPGRVRMLRVAVVAGALVFACTLGPYLLRVEEHGRYYAFNAVFDAMLPEIDPSERPGFLRRIGLSPELATLSGRSGFELGGRLEDLPVFPLLGARLHARAVTELAVRHPRAFQRLLVRGGGEAGRYELPYLGYRTRSFSHERQGLGGVRLWTSLRARWLGGWTAYAVGSALCLLLFLMPRGRDPGGWLTFFRLGCLAFLVASLGQVVIAVLGEGPVERTKHLYFANFLFDVHFLLGLCGVGAAAAGRLGGAQSGDFSSASATKG
ncbi:MAG: hypothetical protein ABI610_00060 [Acidobacteriota bacterium]